MRCSSRWQAACSCCWRSSSSPLLPARIGSADPSSATFQTIVSPLPEWPALAALCVTALRAYSISLRLPAADRPPVARRHHRLLVLHLARFPSYPRQPGAARHDDDVAFDVALYLQRPFPSSARGKSSTPSSSSRRSGTPPTGPARRPRAARRRHQPTRQDIVPYRRDGSGSPQPRPAGC